jgi:hypothetical protein
VHPRDPQGFGDSCDGSALHEPHPQQSPGSWVEEFHEPTDLLPFVKPGDEPPSEGVFVGVVNPLARQHRPGSGPVAYGDAPERVNDVARVSEDPPTSPRSSLWPGSEAMNAKRDIHLAVGVSGDVDMDLPPTLPA